MRALDLRSTLRLVRRRPLFAAGVLLMLGLGIGSTTAIFSVVDGVLLRPLPFPEPDRLVQIYGTDPGRNIGRASLTEADGWDLRDLSRTMTTFGVRHGASFTLNQGGVAERVEGALVSVGFLGALAPQAVVGRLFQAGEDDPAAPVDRVLLSHGFWTRRFGADPAIVGTMLSLDGRLRQVVGVLPPGTPWLDSADVFVPFIRRNDANRSSWEFSGVGRMKAGVTLDALQNDLRRVGRELETQYPKTNRGLTFVAVPSREWVASDSLRRTMGILLAATALLLVIAVVNVTNLLLAHASSRAREVAVRTALGASRADLIRERLTMSVLFSAVGAVLGWAVATTMLGLFKTMDPGGIPRLAQVALDVRALIFTVSVAAIVAVVTGLVPALRAPVGNVVASLGNATRGTVGDRGNDRLRQVLVTAQVALSLVLLLGAGLLVRSLTQVLRTDRGFQTEQRVLASVNIPASYAEPRRAEIVQTILARVESLPQVASAALVSTRPLSPGSTGMGLAAAGKPIPDAKVPWATWRIVTKDYFETLGLPMIAGRSFTEQDTIPKDQPSQTWAVVVSRRVADQFWPGESAVGRRLTLWKGQSNQSGEIIGVVGNMRERGLENEPTLAVYLPAYGALGATTIQIVMHTRGQPDAAAPLLRDVVRNIDPTLPVSSVRTLEEIVTGSVATRRFTMMLLAAFAAVALVLSMSGVYGVLAYTVARRTAEMGVRLAIGASPGQVMTGVFAYGMRPVAIGLALGLAASFWSAEVMSSLLFEVQPRDPLTFAAVTAGVCVVSAIACYMPARQVLHVDPAIALRIE